jgi:hypothetical protein
VWTAFDDLFNVLPLAALVNRRILCVHGGIGRLESLDQVQFQRKTHKMSTNVLPFRSKHMRIAFLNKYCNNHLHFRRKHFVHWEI